MFEQYDDILTIPELSEILKIGNTQAYHLVRSGKIKAFKEGKDWKIPKNALIKYISERTYSPNYNTLKGQHLLNAILPTDFYAVKIGYISFIPNSSN